MGRGVPQGELSELSSLLAGLALCPLTRAEGICTGPWNELRVREDKSQASFSWSELPAAWRPLGAIVDWLEGHAPSEPRLVSLEETDEVE